MRKKYNKKHKNIKLEKIIKIHQIKKIKIFNKKIENHLAQPIRRYENKKQTIKSKIIKISLFLE